MNEPIDIQGVWWLPESPDHKVAGWLRYDVQRGGELRLTGSLREPKWLENRRDGVVVQRVMSTPQQEERFYPRIHGQSGRKIFHLADSFQVHFEKHLCRESDAAEKIHVNWLIAGAWFSGEEQVEFHSALVRLQHLTDWVALTGLETDSFSQDASAPFATAHAKSLPAFEAPIADNCQVRLLQELSTEGDGRNDVVLRQNWVLSLTVTQGQRLEFFTDRVSDFQDLLTIATGKVANIESFHFTHDDVPLRTLGGTPVGAAKERLRYYSRWTSRDDHVDRLSPYAMLFTLDDLGGIDGVQRWMQFATSYRSELSRVMATRYNDQMFLEDRVTHCVAALESFDRTRRGDGHQSSYLVQRLRQCVSLAGAEFLALLGGEKVEDWTDRAKQHRHTLGHHLEAFRNDTGIVEQDLGDQLFWLATFCFLRESGAPPALFGKISDHASFRWVAERARRRHSL